MAETNYQQLIQSIVNAELYTELKTDKKLPLVPVVTLSRSCGANGSAVGKLMAERLGVPMYDQELLDAVVKETKGDKHLMKLLDERLTSTMEDLIHTFFSKKGASKDDFLRAMIKVILGISNSGGVIVGRGAHLLVPASKAFRVRIEGSFPLCVDRVAKRLEIKKSKAEKLVEKTDAERNDYIKKLLKQYPTVRKQFDIVISSDNYTPEQMASILLVAMRAAGFPVPDGAEK